MEQKINEASGRSDSTRPVVSKSSCGLTAIEPQQASQTLTGADFASGGGKLMAEHVRHGEIALIPASQDRFRTTEWFVLETNFLRDSSNRVSGVTLGGGRVAAIRFNRKVSTGAGAPTP